MELVRMEFGGVAAAVGSSSEGPTALPAAEQVHSQKSGTHSTGGANHGLTRSTSLSTQPPLAVPGARNWRHFHHPPHHPNKVMRQHDHGDGRTVVSQPGVAPPEPEETLDIVRA